MNSAAAAEKVLSQRENELRNLQNNIFQSEAEKEDKEKKIYYNPDIEELKKNISLKPKIIKGFIFCK